MKSIDKSTVIDQLKKSKAYRNQALQRHIDSANSLYTLTLNDSQSILSLIWHYRKESQILTPGRLLGGKLYTIGDIAQRMINKNITFEGLVNKDYPGTYDPNWFKACLEIDKNFDPKKIDTFTLLLPNNAERRDCPHGTFRLIDGAHRSLVIAKKILENNWQPQSIPAILLLTPAPKLIEL